jgi:hypothetical protein
MIKGEGKPESPESLKSPKEAAVFAGIESSALESTQ